ncbi:VOC family protein [Streptomyces thinghirensis]|nr:VOC family protein [Streptomyces thinghirensis]
MDDQAKAQRFYTEILGFVTKHDMPVGSRTGGLPSCRSTSPAAPNSSWDPPATRPVKAYRDALVEDGIPLAQFAVDDVKAEYERLRGLGVHFTQEPLEMGPVTAAVFDDTCGNLIQIATEPRVGRLPAGARRRRAPSCCQGAECPPAAGSPKSNRKPLAPGRFGSGMPVAEANERLGPSGLRGAAARTGGSDGPGVVDVPQASRT